MCTRKATISEKNSLIKPFFYSVHTFTRIRQHCFAKYHGGADAWAVPQLQFFWRAVPPVPPRSPPLAATECGIGLPNTSCPFSSNKYFEIIIGDIGINLTSIILFTQ